MNGQWSVSETEVIVAIKSVHAEQAESMPLHGTVGQLLNRLIAAGVGQRPVIFVTHRYCSVPRGTLHGCMQLNW